MQEIIQGMVLSSIPVGEYDKRLVILTKEKGRIAAFARGARKPNSPLMGCSQPFSFGEFSIFSGRNSYTLSSASISNYFSELRQDLGKVYYGLYFCEFAEYYTRENLECFDVLKLLYQSLRALSVPSLSKELVRYIFELKMLVINGESPAVFCCKQCNSEKDLSYFSVDDASVYCNHCGKKAGSFNISTSTLYALQFIIASPIEKLYTFTVTEKVLFEIGKVIKMYTKRYVNHTFKTMNQIEEILFL